MFGEIMEQYGRVKSLKHELKDIKKELDAIGGT